MKTKKAFTQLMIVHLNEVEEEMEKNERLNIFKMFSIV